MGCSWHASSQPRELPQGGASTHLFSLSPSFPPQLIFLLGGVPNQACWISKISEIGGQAFPGPWAMAAPSPLFHDTAWCPAVAWVRPPSFSPLASSADTVLFEACWPVPEFPKALCCLSHTSEPMIPSLHSLLGRWSGGESQTRECRDPGQQVRWGH